MDFWSLFGRGKEVLGLKLKELKVRTNDDPPDVKAALGTFDFLMDASKSLSEENIAAVKDTLYDCPREIDTNVIIAQELIAPLLGLEGIIVVLKFPPRNIIRVTWFKRTIKVKGRVTNRHLERTWHW